MHRSDTIVSVDRDRLFDLIRAVRVGILYFAIVFAAGFVLGTFREIFIAPFLGDRSAELLEIPVMLVISYLAARGLIRHFKIGPTLSARVTVGAVGLGLLLLAELTLVLWFQHMTITQYVSSRDPLSGTVYLLSLLLLGLFPLIVRYSRP